MNFSKNPFIGADKVSKTNSIKNINNFGRASVEDIRQGMLQNNINMNQQSRELVKKREEELKRQHEAFADRQRMYNTSSPASHKNAVNAQNEIRRGFRNGN